MQAGHLRRDLRTRGRGDLRRREPLTCPRCGLEPGAICDGYPSPEDIAILLEECPPSYIAAIAQALRDHKEGKANEGLIVELDTSRGGAQEWTVTRNMKQRIVALARKKA